MKQKKTQNKLVDTIDKENFSFIQYLDQSNFQNNLTILKKLIAKYDIPVSIEDINKYITNRTTDCISYTFKKVVFNVKKSIAKTHPKGEHEYFIYLYHELKTKKCQSHIESFIEDFYFDLTICSNYMDDETILKELKSCWHLDKDIDGGNQPKFTHPIYHFQFGGNLLENVDTGGLVIVPAPRIPHPPMDIFLSFHFIINNFYSSKDYDFVKKLSEHYEYKQIIKQSQEKLWDPYFEGFQNNSSSFFTLQSIFPLYIQ